MLSRGSVSGVSSVETSAAASGVGAGGGGAEEFEEFAVVCCVRARLRMVTSGRRSIARFTA